MSEITKEIVVNVPLKTVYNQWTQFEQFPRFMQGVKKVEQLNDKRIAWTAEVAGKLETWEAEITEQIPYQRIAWRSVTGTTNAGDVRFFPEGAYTSRIRLHIVYKPLGLVESIGDAFGVLARRVEKDLERFKEFIEAIGTETGAWRGKIQHPSPSGTINPESPHNRF